MIIYVDCETVLFSKKLARIIIKKYEDKIIESIINENYNLLMKNEQMFIKGRCKRILNEHRADIYKYIVTRIKDFVENERQINIDGFIQFRLKEYRNGIINAVDSAMAEFIAEYEYEKFVNELILYTEFHESVIDELIIIKLKDKYILSDKKENEIMTVSKFDDVLLDVLLTLIPKKIFLYNPELVQNKQLLNTIKRIFGKRVNLISYTI